MSDVPLEVRTLKFRRNPKEKFRVVVDKHGQESRVNWPLELTYETEKDGIRGTATFWFRSNDLAWMFTPISWADLQKKYPEDAARVRLELESLRNQLQPELEKKRAEVVESARKRLTGTGAEKRRAKIVDMLSEALLGAGPKLDPRVLHGVFLTHAGSVLLSQVGENGQFIVQVEARLSDRLRENNVSPDEFLTCIESLHGCRLKDSIQHASGHPTHWRLLTVKDFEDALNRARVKEVLSS